MHKRYLANIVAISAFAFVGGMASPLILPNAYAVSPQHKTYHVLAGCQPSDIEKFLNKETEAGWKFEQAVSEGQQNVDLVFSK